MSTTPTIVRRRPRLAPALLAVAALLGVLAATSLVSSADDDRPPASAGPDGTFTARAVDVFAASASVLLDEVEVLSGEEARRAAVDDGELPEGEDLPNDVYVRDVPGAERRVTVDPGAEVQLIACELDAPCDLAEVPLADFLQGRARASSGDHAVFTVTVEGGALVSIVEVYLP